MVQHTIDEHFQYLNFPVVNYNFTNLKQSNFKMILPSSHCGEVKVRLLKFSKMNIVGEK